MDILFSLENQLSVSICPMPETKKHGPASKRKPTWNEMMGGCWHGPDNVISPLIEPYKITIGRE